MIVITGGSRGIGKASAERFLEAGKDVLIVARAPAAAVTELNQLAKPGKCHGLAADLSTVAGCDRVLAWITERGEQPAALINNLGQYEPGGLMDEVDRLESLLRTNLLSAHRITRRLLPALLTHGNARIITVGSVSALDFPKQMSAYTVSKYALHGWHQALSRELAGQPLSCCLIVPGATLTSAWAEENNIPAQILSSREVGAEIFRVFREGCSGEVILRP